MDVEGHVADRPAIAEAAAQPDGVEGDGRRRRSRARSLPERRYACRRVPDDRTPTTLAHDLARRAVAAADPSTIRVVHAPGRVNLIGEHTDYNDGFVLPAAIDLGITIALVPTDDRRVALTLADGRDATRSTLDAIGRAPRRLDRLRRGHRLGDDRGRACPSAASAASSPPTCRPAPGCRRPRRSSWRRPGRCPAASRPTPDPMTLARIAQRAENAYVGVQCGLMDQFAVGVRGRRPRAAARLPLARAPAGRPAGRDAPGHLPLGMPRGPGRLRVQRPPRRVRPGGRRAPGAGPGGRAACATSRPSCSSAGRDRLDDVAYRRARHVVTENARVLEADRGPRGRRPRRGRGGVRGQPRLAARRLRGQLAGPRRPGRHRRRPCPGSSGRG